MVAAFWVVKTKQFNALQAREKIIVAATVFLGLYLLFNVFAFGPSQLAIKKLNEDLAAKNTQLTGLKAQQQLLAKMLNRDPLTPLKHDLDALNVQLAQLDEAIAKVAGGFVPASQLPVMLQQVLTLTESVQMEHILTLPPEKIALNPNDSAVVAVKQKAVPAGDSPEANNTAISLHRQGVVLQLVGDYGALLNAVQKIEQSPWHIYWESLQYTVTDYPLARLNVQLYTLTLVNPLSRADTPAGEQSHVQTP